MTKKGYIYILTNRKNWTLYIWVTSNLEKRIYEHKNKIIDWFSKKYDLTMLVYYESFEDIKDAIERAKQLKWWSRIKKIKLIEKINLDWKDLSEELF